MADILIREGFNKTTKTAYLIGSPGLREELEEAGVKCFGQGPDPMRGGEFDDDVFLDKDAFLYEDHLVCCFQCSAITNAFAATIKSFLFSDLIIEGLCSILVAMQ